MPFPAIPEPDDAIRAARVRLARLLSQTQEGVEYIHSMRRAASERAQSCPPERVAFWQQATKDFDTVLQDSGAPPAPEVPHFRSKEDIRAYLEILKAELEPHDKKVTQRRRSRDWQIDPPPLRTHLIGSE